MQMLTSCGCAAADYPFKPPGIKMSTPSGRFKPGASSCSLLLQPLPAHANYPFTHRHQDVRHLSRHDMQ